MFRYRTLATVSVALAFSCTTLATSVPATEWTSSIGCREIVGTYLVTVLNNGSFASRSLLSFTKGGILLATDSGQGGMSGQFAPFSNSQGAWTCEQRRGAIVEVSATALNFTFPDDPAARTIARLDYQVTLDRGRRPIYGPSVYGPTLYGTIDLSFFGLGDDPYQVQPVPSASFTFVGERIRPAG